MDSALELSPSLIASQLQDSSSLAHLVPPRALRASTLLDFFALVIFGIFKFMSGNFEKCKGDDAYLLQLG